MSLYEINFCQDCGTHMTATSGGWTCPNAHNHYPFRSATANVPAPTPVPGAVEAPGALEALKMVTNLLELATPDKMGGTPDLFHPEGNSFSGWEQWEALAQEWIQKARALLSSTAPTPSGPSPEAPQAQAAPYVHVSLESGAKPETVEALGVAIAGAIKLAQEKKSSPQRTTAAEGAARIKELEEWQAKANTFLERLYELAFGSKDWGPWDDLELALESLAKRLPPRTQATDLDGDQLDVGYFRRRLKSLAEIVDALKPSQLADHLLRLARMAGAESTQGEPQSPSPAGGRECWVEWWRGRPIAVSPEIPPKDLRADGTEWIHMVEAGEPENGGAR